MNESELLNPLRGDEKVITRRPEHWAGGQSVVPHRRRRDVGDRLRHTITRV
jgi:hypothetical protein